MTIRDILNILQSQNKQVSFYVRKDGGIRITRIGTQTFRGSKGNAFARKMVGATLSEARARQLSKLKTPKGKGSYDKRRREKLDTDTLKRIKRLQSWFRRKKLSGRPTIKNYRYNLKNFGKEEADRLLTQVELYSKGIIYEENVNYLINRVSQIKSKVSEKYQEQLDEIINKLESMRTSMRYDPTYLKMIDASGPLYALENRRIKIDEAIRRINEILDAN